MIECLNMSDNRCINDIEWRRCAEVPGNVCRAKLFVNGKKVESKFVESYSVVMKEEISSGEDW